MTEVQNLESISPTISSDFVWQITCPFDPPHYHTYWADWTFGGASGMDPTADPRWKPDTYLYFSDKAELLHQTQAPKCDDEAIDYFTQVAGWFPKDNPTFLWVKRHGERDSTPLPVRYNADTDEVYDT